VGQGLHGAVETYGDLLLPNGKAFSFGVVY